jgi:phosphate transport system ATP-binding protein
MSPPITTLASQAHTIEPPVVPPPVLHLVADNGPRRVGGRAPSVAPHAAAPVLTPVVAWPADPKAAAPPPPVPPPVAPVMTAPQMSSASSFSAPTEFAAPSMYAPSHGSAVPASAPLYAPPAQNLDAPDSAGETTAVLSPLQIVEAPAPPFGALPTQPPAETRVPAGPLAALEGRNISAWFGDRKVLDHVSLLMPAGECTALIGPSGCGKSTFLRILNRMHELIPSASLAGEVLLDGQDLYARENRLTDARRQVGMVFQKPNPFPAMSIYDNVIAGLRLTGKKVGQGMKDELVESCLTKAGLWKEVKDRLRQPGGGLSGGQQQRLCIARSLAIKPRVLLMDEPCSALDPTSTRRIEQTIRELVDEVTIVIVTHNMQQAARVSDKCAFFLAEAGTPGVIVEHGATDAMFNSPSDPRTYDYVNGRFG